MPRENLNDLQASSTLPASTSAAAAQLGVSQSALSHAMRGLEQRLGVRLLTRTTRSVSTTEAGARLLETLAPRLAEIEDGWPRWPSTVNARPAPSASMPPATPPSTSPGPGWRRCCSSIRI